jgi:hypothetical protein
VAEVGEDGRLAVAVTGANVQDHDAGRLLM